MLLNLGRALNAPDNVQTDQEREQSNERSDQDPGNAAGREFIADHEVIRWAESAPRAGAEHAIIQSAIVVGERAHDRLVHAVPERQIAEVEGAAESVVAINRRVDALVVEARIDRA